MSTIIPRNSAIPIKKTERYSTVTDNQTRVRVQVLQGEQKLAADNHKADQFSLEGIPKAPAGQESVDVTIEIDANGLLKVTACAVNDPDKVKSIVITRDKMLNLSREELEELA